MSETNQVLIECTNLHRDDYADFYRVLDKGGLKWQNLLASAQKHGLIPLLHYHLRNLSKVFKAQVIPDGVVDWLEKEYHASAAVTICSYAALKKILDAFNAANIEAIVLKGAALAETIYPNSTLRPFSDIDLLILENDWVRAREALLELGFTPCGRDFPVLLPKLIEGDLPAHLHFRNSKGIDVELQFDLLLLGVPTKSLKDVWSTAIKTKIADAPAKILSCEYQLLHLCVHLNKHGFRRLIWFCDIAELLRAHGEKINWDGLYQIARLENVQCSIYYTLSCINELFGELTPRDVLEHFRLGYLKAKIWELIWPEKHILEFKGAKEAGLLFDKRLFSKWFIPNLVLMGRVKEKLSYFIRKAFPSLDYLSQKYSRPKSRRLYSYYLRRPAGLLLRGVKRGGAKKWERFVYQKSNLGR